MTISVVLEAMTNGTCDSREKAQGVSGESKIRPHCENTSLQEGYSSPESCRSEIR